MTEMMSKIINIPGGLTWDNAPAIVHDFLVSEMIFSVMVILICIGLLYVCYGASNIIDRRIEEAIENNENVDYPENVSFILIVLMFLEVTIMIFNIYDIIQMVVTPSIYVLDNYKW